jgi:hypothetical protein
MCRFLSVALFLTSASVAVATTLQDDLARAVVIDPVQPPPAVIEKIEQQPQLGQPYRPNVLMKDGISYDRYHALREGSEYVIHPMRMGRFLLENAKGTLARTLTDAAVGLALELPNGGLAWFYPKHYRVSRMMGDRQKYSTISQGTLLSGLAAMAQSNPGIDMALAKKTYLAMLWPFEKGGTNLANRAVLEMPSFAGPPEIILNGWIDALLHTRDYVALSGDEEARQFFRANVAFLAEILPNFDAPDANISRYSDLSPYQVQVTLASPTDVDSLRILYRPMKDSLPSILVPLARTKDPKNYSNYENQILSQDGRSAQVWVSCSQLYDTVLLADTDQMILEVGSGVLDRKQSAPGPNGKTLKLVGVPVDGRTQHITLGTSNGLICGYPTNFSKSKKDNFYNFYHVYHVVSLMLLALGGDVEVEQQKVLIRWALKWYEDMREIQSSEKLGFRDPQELLEGTNRTLAVVQHRNFEGLLANARAVLEGAKQP